MKKVKILNNVNGRSFIAKFDNEAEMNEWISGRILNKSWGENELEYTIEIEDITESHNLEKQRTEDISKGEKIEFCCKNISRLITGYLMRNNFSKQQEDIFDLSFSSIFNSLDRSKIKKARKLIEDLSVDGEIITKNLKDNCLSILTRNEF